MSDTNPHPIYRIKVVGKLHPSWDEWLNYMDIRYDETGATIIEGAVPDQSALRGLLNRIWDLNLTVISVIRLTA
jgi:hypothetical protein